MESRYILLAILVQIIWKFYKSPKVSFSDNLNDIIFRHISGFSTMHRLRNCFEGYSTEIQTISKVQSANLTNIWRIMKTGLIFAIWQSQKKQVQHYNKVFLRHEKIHYFSHINMYGDIGIRSNN